MKNQKHFNHSNSTLLLILLIAFFISCTKENTEPIGNGKIETSPGITEEELGEYAGDLGIVVDAASVSIKGYYPVKAKFTINATQSDISQTIDLDEYSLMGQIKLSIDKMSSEAEKELKEGVETTIELLDNTGKIIATENFSKLSFKSNPDPVPFDADKLKDLNTTVVLNKDTKYYAQILDKDNNPVKNTMKYTASAPKNNPGIIHRIVNTYNVEFTGAETAFLFNFIAIPNEPNTYAIKTSNNRYAQVIPNIIFITKLFPFAFENVSVMLSLLELKGNIDFQKIPENAKFIIEKESNAVYSIKTKQGKEIRVRTGLGFTIDTKKSTKLRFRFIPMNIEWAIEDIETRHLAPILPPSQTGFSFNNTLINCGNGKLEQTVGASITEKIITSVGWENSLSMMSSHTYSVSATVGVEFEAGFFGTSAKYSASVTAGYENTSQNTIERSSWEDKTTEKEETYFSERTVTVPSKNASLVYDAIQFYENIKVPFAQRLRIRGTEFDTREKLSGHEILSQFHFNNFDGIINEIGTDYIEVSIKGVTTLNKVIKTKSEVQEVAPMCK